MLYGVFDTRLLGFYILTMDLDVYFVLATVATGLFDQVQIGETAFWLRANLQCPRWCFASYLRFCVNNVYLTCTWFRISLAAFP
jgi:hypothetical protein